MEKSRKRVHTPTIIHINAATIVHCNSEQYYLVRLFTSDCGKCLAWAHYGHIFSTLWEYSVGAHNLILLGSCTKGALFRLFNSNGVPENEEEHKSATFRTSFQQLGGCSTSVRIVTASTRNSLLS